MVRGLLSDTGLGLWPSVATHRAGSHVAPGKANRRVRRRLSRTIPPRLTPVALSTKTTPVRAALAAAVICAAILLGTGSAAGVESSLDPSDVVLAFDFSNSILLSGDKANEEFAAALRKIADRVAIKADDLMAGDATISFEVFGGKAVTVDGCTQLSLHDNPNAVGQFEKCLRDVASEYDRGRRSSFGKKVGSADTDHVAALEEAAGLLPATSGRPAVIFFTDGRHDPAGDARDKEDVAAEIQPSYAGFDHIAILPVGLGPDAPAFVSELEAIRTIRGMEACGGQDTLTWSDVVFASPQGAGLAVATALQKVTCSYLAETPSPTPAPSPTPTPAPTLVPSAPGPPQGVAAEPTNEGLLLTWAAPASIGTSPITGYTVHCRRSDTGAWEPPTTAGSTITQAQLNGLEPGYPYECQVAAVNSVGQGSWSAATTAVAPLGLPPAPGKPSTEAGDSQVAVSVPDPGDVSVLVKSYLFECADGQGSAPVVQPAPDRSTTITGLMNGTEYTCRAYAENELGPSAASPSSDAFRPCSNLFECHPSTRWLALLLALVLLALLAWLLLAYLRGPRRWLTAVLDDGDTTGLGWGPKLGARIERDDGAFAMRSDRRPAAPIRLRDLRGEHVEVTFAGATTKVRPGQSTQVTDDEGIAHNLILRRYARPPKPPKPTEEDPWSSSSRSSATSTATADEEVWS